MRSRRSSDGQAGDHRARSAVVKADGLPLPRRRVAYVTLAIVVAMSVLDGTIANTALPTIARDLRATPTESIWVVNGFQLAVTASLLSFAALGQLRGPARVYRVGVAIFVVGSLASALARSLPELIAARAFQGLGASAVMALSPAILRDIFPRAQLGRALGLNALVVATSAAAGPTIGGLILALLPWPWLFAINVPLGIASIAMNRALPREPRNRGWLDAPSVVMSAVGFSLLIWGVDALGRHEPDWSVALRLAVGLVCAVAFVRRQFVLPRPMIALDLFRIRPFAFAATTSFATFSAQGLSYIALPFYFQIALGRTPLESGLLADVVAARDGDRRADRRPPRRPRARRYPRHDRSRSVRDGPRPVRRAAAESEQRADRAARLRLRARLRLFPGAEQPRAHRQRAAREERECVRNPCFPARRRTDGRHRARRARVRCVRRLGELERRAARRGRSCGARGALARVRVRGDRDGRQRTAAHATVRAARPRARRAVRPATSRVCSARWRRRPTNFATLRRKARRF